MSQQRSNVWSSMIIRRSLFCAPCLHSAWHQTWQQVTEDVMLMAGSSTEALGQHRQGRRRKLFADKWDLVQGLSGINCWVLLVEKARYHCVFFFVFMLLWQSGWRWREQRRLVTQRCRALLNRWQETSEESGNGQQMEKRSCRRPEECMTHCQARVPADTKCLMSVSSCYSQCLKFCVRCQTYRNDA